MSNSVLPKFQSVKYQLNVKLVSDNQKLLEYYQSLSSHHDGDSGVDLYSIEMIKGSEIYQVSTIDFEIQCEMFDLTDNTLSSYYLVPRSSLSNTPFQLANSVGIIDAGYRGNLKAKIRCFKETPYKLSTYNNELCRIYLNELPKLSEGRWFQIVAPDLKPIRVNLVTELSETTRGVGGFGSTN
jgi:dUTP pyrophosphatase